MELALAAARSGKDLFIEKPLSITSDGLAALSEKVAAKDLVCEVGCQLRAHPGLRALAQRLRDGTDGRILAFRGVVGQSLDRWRPGTDYRDSYSARAESGGGPLFDLIHEIDLALWLVGPMESVLADVRHVSNLEMTADDLVNIILVARNGAAGQIQMEMLSPAYRRSFEVVTERAVYSWEYETGAVRRHDGERDESFHAPNPALQRNDLFTAHMAHFLDRLQCRDVATYCGLEDGAMALDVALAARLGAQSGQRTPVLPTISSTSPGRHDT